MNADPSRPLKSKGRGTSKVFCSCKSPRSLKYKDRYTTREYAEKALTELRAKFGETSDLHTYRCDVGNWHIGRRSKRS